MAQEYRFKQKYPEIQEQLDHNLNGNKNYDKSTFSGFGRVYLDKNVKTVGGVQKNLLEQSMLNMENTVYVIQYDFDLKGESIRIPENCVLKFEGGSLSNGYLSGTILNDVLDFTYINTDDIGTFISGLRFANPCKIILKEGATYNIAHKIRLIDNNVELDGNGATINCTASDAIYTGAEPEMIFTNGEADPVVMPSSTCIQDADIAATVEVGDVLRIFENEQIAGREYQYGMESTVIAVEDDNVWLSIAVPRKQYNRIVRYANVHDICVHDLTINNNRTTGSPEGITVNSHYSKVYNIRYYGNKNAVNGIGIGGTYDELYGCEVYECMGSNYDRPYKAGYGINATGNFARVHHNRCFCCRSGIDGGHRYGIVVGIEVWGNVVGDTMGDSVFPLDHYVFGFHGGAEVYCHDNNVYCAKHPTALALRGDNQRMENNTVYYDYIPEDDTVYYEIATIREIAFNATFKNNRFILGEGVDFASQKARLLVDADDQSADVPFEGCIEIVGNTNIPFIQYSQSKDKSIVRDNVIIASNNAAIDLYTSTFNRLEIAGNIISTSVSFVKTSAKVTTHFKELIVNNNTVTFPSGSNLQCVFFLRQKTQEAFERVVVTENKIVNNNDNSINLFYNKSILMDYFVNGNELVNVDWLTPEPGPEPKPEHFSSGPVDDVPATDVIGYRYFATDLGKNLYWDGTEWKADTLTPMVRYTYTPTMYRHARCVNTYRIKAVIGQEYAWAVQLTTLSTSGTYKFDTCALLVPAGVKIKLLGSGMAHNGYPWLMLDADNIVLAAGSSAMGGIGKDQILYEGTTPSECKLLVNVINQDATVLDTDPDSPTYGQDIPYPYWNKDAQPYVVELSAWTDFSSHVVDLLAQNDATGTVAEEGDYIPIGVYDPHGNPVNPEQQNDGTINDNDNDSNS
jgi:hypothetical protein